jgi:S-adenosylmethionine hydrolase
MAIVDPGVGTARRAVAVSVSGGDGILIGPDNGLLATGVALAGGGEAAFELNKTEYHLAAPGTTFAGRDIFASVAAHLCNGVPLSEVGTEIDVASILPGIVPVPREEHGKMLAEVTWVDHFGNCQLNVGPDEITHMGSPVRVTIGSLTAATAGQQPVVRSVPIVRNFSEIGAGLGLVVDSFGMLALCIDRGSAAQQLDLGTTELVVIEPDPQAGQGVATAVQIGSKQTPGAPEA